MAEITVGYSDFVTLCQVEDTIEIEGKKILDIGNGFCLLADGVHLTPPSADFVILAEERAAATETHPPPWISANRYYHFPAH